jgi:hypothetical protein
MSARRPVHAHEARTMAAQSQPRPSVRERVTHEAFPHLDNEWDIPAFQRKQR